jgi:hypothetical protein
MNVLRPVLLLSLLLVTVILQSQENRILSAFNGKASGDKILLSWTISGGQTCNGTLIERSDDTVHFSRVGEIPGICGNSESPVPYSFTDDSPLPNKINYYRLELGGQGYSKIVGVPYYEYGNQGSIAIPNPSSEKATIYFGNSREDRYVFRLFDVKGRKIMETEGVSNSIEVETNRLGPGMFVYSIESARSHIKGKLIVR